MYNIYSVNIADTEYIYNLTWSDHWNHFVSETDKC